MANNGGPALLVVGSGGDVSHGDLLAGLARTAPILLLEPGEVTWQRDLVADAAGFAPGDLDAAVRAARRLVSGRSVAAAVSYLEPLLVLTARVAEATGLPAMSHDVALVVRDKWRQRKALGSAGPPPTRSALALDLDGAREAAQRIGYPVVIKPRSFSGGLGVRFADGPGDLERAWDEVRGTASRGALSAEPGALVEERLRGPQFSVNCWVRRGTARALSVSRTWEDDPGPPVTGWIMGTGLAEAAVVRKVAQAACAAALACGLDGTVADVELVWMDGEPRILEVNGRPAGDQASRMAALVYDVDLGAELGRAALGGTAAAVPAPRRAVGIVFLFPPEPMVFGGLRLPEDIRLSGWLERVHAIPAPGTEVAPPPADPWGRIGWALVVGPDTTVVARRMAAVRGGAEVVPGDPRPG